jgi:hypothetical protein
MADLERWAYQEYGLKPVSILYHQLMLSKRRS